MWWLVIFLWLTTGLGGGLCILSDIWHNTKSVNIGNLVWCCVLSPLGGPIPLLLFIVYVLDTSPIWTASLIQKKD